MEQFRWNLRKWNQENVSLGSILDFGNHYEKYEIRWLHSYVTCDGQELHPLGPFTPFDLQHHDKG